MPPCDRGDGQNGFGAVDLLHQHRADHEVGPGLPSKLSAMSAFARSAGRARLPADNECDLVSPVIPHFSSTAANSGLVGSRPLSSSTTSTLQSGTLERSSSASWAARAGPSNRFWVQLHGSSAPSSIRWRTRAEIASWAAAVAPDGGDGYPHEDLTPRPSPRPRYRQFHRIRRGSDGRVGRLTALMGAAMVADADRGHL